MCCIVDCARSVFRCVRVTSIAASRKVLPERETRPHDRPRPRIINTVAYPDGSCVHMASTSQGYGYFGAGHGPAYVEGVRLESWPDDGSKEWAALFSRVQSGPVRDRWQGR